MPFLPIHDEIPRKWIAAPYVGWAIMLFCVILYIWQSGLTGRQEYQLFFAFGFTPSVFFGDLPLAPHLDVIPSWATLITTQFLHASPWHLIGNMLFLYIFGDLVEDYCGHWRFLLFFLLTGTLAALAHGFSAADADAPLVGASGSISGIMAAYVVLRPRAKITALMPFFVPVSLPVWVWVGGWFLYQTFAQGGLLGSDGVAYAAHIGGFMAGLCLIMFLKRPDAGLFNREPDPADAAVDQTTP